MMGLFSNLIFMNPWILSGLAILPGLYLLLRIMPPAPKFIVLPTARFLKGLVPETQTPSHTPWWILLLRLLAAALVLIALAAPVYNPSGQLAGSGPVRVVIENGWAGAQVWNNILKNAEEIITQASREGREIYILTTAAHAGEEKPVQQGPLSSDEALSIARGLKPQAWASNHQLASEIVTGEMESYWLGSGIDEKNLAVLAQKLSELGGLHYYGPEKVALPLALGPVESSTQDVQINVVASGAVPTGTPVTVQALAQDGRILDSKDVTIIPEKLPITATFDIPESLRGEIGMFKIAGRSSAGATFLLDDRHQKRSVGIVSPAEEAESAPLIEAGFYLKRALEPYSSLTMGGIDTLLELNPSVIILPDIDALPADQLNALESWVKKGGLLLRFAGPNMTRTDSENYLVPVPLRKGGRTLDGSLTWEQPQKLAAFEDKSPYFGLKVPDDITIRQQVLPELASDLDEKTWARLEDGTPLITAGPLERGMIVLIHTTATPEWSDFALSGLYVDILRRTIAMAGSAFDATRLTTGQLDPIMVLDGFGAVQEPASTARGIAAEDFEETLVSSIHPPGIYGNSSFRQALNVGDDLKMLKAATAFPVSTQQITYGSSYEQSLMAPLLYAAMVLLFADWFIMFLIAAGNRPFWRFTAIALACLLPLPAHAQSEQDIKHADGLYLAYVLSGDAYVDGISQKGLESLSQVLAQRTSIEPAGVIGISPESDELAFYPLIYWPVTTAQAALTPEGTKNIQNYLDHGGTILFDTRDANYRSDSFGETENGIALKRIVGTLNVSPLMPAAKDHVLTRSFYLLKSFPGKYDRQPLWVEQQSANGRDGVSSVIIGGNDWAAAWAAGRGDRLALSGGSRQQEMASRFGVNLVMYALTGNYKADQVHVPYILERLGQ